MRQTVSDASPNAIPILLYHGIAPNPSDEMSSFTVHPEAFERHMDTIVARGYTSMTVSELMDARAAGQVDFSRVVLVTFDDGYADFVLHALPVLRARSISSTMYVTTGYVPGTWQSDVPRPADPVMSWSEICDLPKDSVPVEIGAHSHSHPKMDTVSRGRVYEELVRPKALLEDALNAPVRSFAYPHGYSTRYVREQVRAAGYDSGVAVKNVLSHPTDDPLRLARLTVRSFTADQTVNNWLERRDSEVATSHESFKTKGWRLYRQSRSVGSYLEPLRK